MFSSRKILMDILISFGVIVVGCLLVYLCFGKHEAFSKGTIIGYIVIFFALFVGSTLNRVIKKIHKEQ